MKRLKIEPIEAEAFAPFGQLLPRLPPGAGRQELIEELQNDRASARPRLSIATTEPKALPLTAVKMERHVHSSQAFAPLDCAGYLVMVAPHGENGGPELEKIRAFHVPGDTGINYKAATWHHPLTPLERIGRFAILTFVDGTPGDEEWADLPEPVLIEE
ncbi:MAG: ureidoglycolate lyase [Hyphomicrobiales bacterium]|nr:ureidoglycolate lyase [Hyphomicrobiales bacterium]